MRRRTRGTLGLLWTVAWLGGMATMATMANEPDAAPPAPPLSVIPARFDSLGLSTPAVPQPGKAPVILIHGLWVGPRTWEPMIRALAADPAVAASHQFWTFGYATNDPIPYSANRLRAAIDEARDRLDPDHRDPALDRAVLIGHSMGGLIAKLTTIDSGDALWKLVSDHPHHRLNGDPADVALARDCLMFKARPDVRAVIYLATPHGGGGSADLGVLHDLAGRFVPPPGPLLAMYHRLLAANPPDFFRPALRSSLVNSLDELRLGSPMLRTVRELRPAPGIARHSIIAVRDDGSRGPEGDGVVSYESAHLEGVDSETVIPSGHFCQDSPAAIAEVRRILLTASAR